MIPEVTLAILYTAVFVFLILRLRFFKRFHLSPKIIAGIFILKVLAGIAYGYIHLHYYGGGDTQQYFTASKVLTDRLKDHHPEQYLQMVFGINTYPAPEHLKPYAYEVGNWSDMSAYFIIRFHGLVRLISFGYYNVHVIFYNFLTLLGLLYLFRFFADIVTEKKKLVAAAIFLFPSVIFWSSGMHKDGISLAALGLILFSLKDLIHDQGLKEQPAQKRWTKLLLLLAGLWLMIVVRNFWLILLLPAFIALVWTWKFPKHPLLKFLAVFLVYFGLASNVNLIKPEWDFLNLLVLKQNEFLGLTPGYHTLKIPLINHSIGSILSSILPALSNCLLRPWINEPDNLFMALAFAENIFVLLFLLLSIVFRQKHFPPDQKSLIWFCLVFSFTLFMVIGITVPILGAVVRYKMGGVLFLLLASITLIKPSLFQRKKIPELVL